MRKIPNENQHLTTTHADAADRIGEVLITLQDDTIQPYKEEIDALRKPLETIANGTPAMFMSGNAERSCSLCAAHIETAREALQWAPIPEMSGVPRAGCRPLFDLVAHLQRQREFSERTFGPGARTKGVLDHIRKELNEIEADPTDISEWIDVVLLALDGAWRHGFTPEQIADALAAKQAKNEARTWPDWRTADPTKAIEHVRA